MCNGKGVIFMLSATWWRLDPVFYIENECMHACRDLWEPMHDWRECIRCSTMTLSHEHLQRVIWLFVLNMTAKKTKEWNRASSMQQCASKLLIRYALIESAIFICFVSTIYLFSWVALEWWNFIKHSCVVSVWRSCYTLLLTWSLDGCRDAARSITRNERSIPNELCVLCKVNVGNFPWRLFYGTTRWLARSPSQIGISSPITLQQPSTLLDIWNSG